MNTKHITTPTTPKGGSSSLHKYLRSHPSIISSNRENHALIKKNITGPSYDKIINKPSSHTHNYTMDISVGYCYKNHDPLIPFNNLLRLKPKSKILLLMRNPINRMYSNYNMMSSNHKNNFNKQWLWWVKKKDQILMTDYITHYKLWSSKFETKIVVSEDLFRDTKNTMKDIFNFLDLDPIDITDPIIHNKGRYSNRLSPDTVNQMKNYYTQMVNELSNVTKIDFKEKWKIK